MYFIVWFLATAFDIRRPLPASDENLAAKYSEINFFLLEM